MYYQPRDRPSWQERLTAACLIGAFLIVILKVAFQLAAGDPP